MHNQTLPTSPPAIGHQDRVFTGALPSELIVALEGARESLGPNRSVSVALRFANGDLRAYDLTDQHLQYAIVGALRAASPLCTERDFPVMPSHYDAIVRHRGSGSISSSLVWYSLQPVESVIKATACRNALVIDLLLDRRRPDRWVIPAMDIAELEKSFRRAFPLMTVPWRVAPIDPTLEHRLDYDIPEF